MGLTDVRTLFRDQLEGLGYEEHPEPFQPNQIAETLVDRSFHLETGSIISGPANQTVHSFEFPITVRVYSKGYENLLEAYDELHQTADDILANILNQNVRLVQSPNIKDIVPESVEIEPMAESNDDILVLVLAFTAKLELCYVTDI
jgi:hypothetical protein